MAVRSATFVRKALDLKEIKEDVEAIRALSADQMRALCEFLSDGETLQTRSEALGDRLQTFLSSQSMSGESFQRARRLLLFIVSCHDSGDSPETVVDDLNEKVGLAEPKEEGFSVYSFIQSMLPTIRQTIEDGLRESATHRGMPFLTGISYSCDVRMVVNRPFAPLTQELASYHPQPVSWIPIAIVNLRTDEETDLCFQVDLDRLNTVMETFGAIHKDLILAKNTLKKAGLPARHQGEAEIRSEICDENP